MCNNYFRKYIIVKLWRSKRVVFYFNFMTTGRWFFSNDKNGILFSKKKKKTIESHSNFIESMRIFRAFHRVGPGKKSSIIFHLGEGQKEIKRSPHPRRVPVVDIKIILRIRRTLGRSFKIVFTSIGSRVFSF